MRTLVFLVVVLALGACAGELLARGLYSIQHNTTSKALSDV